MPKDELVQSNPDTLIEDHGKLGPDVYESAKKFNFQLATRGVAVQLALSKASEKLTSSNVITAIGGMVVGAFGFFGNRYFRQKGDVSTDSYMGEIVGGVQFTAGFMLLAIAAYEVYNDTSDPSPLLNVINMAGVALTLTESALILVNSYLYGDGPTKAAPEPRPKIN